MWREQNKHIYFLFTLPALLLYAIFYIYPVMKGFQYSLTDWNGISPDFNWIGLHNYLEILGDKRFMHSLIFTLKYTGFLVFFVLVISLLIALLLNSKLKFNTFFRSIFFFPAVLSLITVGLIWNQVFYSVLPEIGRALGIDALSKNILGSSNGAMIGILIANVWQGIAIPAVIFLAGLQSIPKDMYEAATMDGANAWDKFKNITFPFLVPMFTVNLVLVMKSGLTVFDYIKAMTDGGPGYATESIGLLIYQHGFTELKFGYGAAEAIVLFILFVLIAVVQINFLNRKGVGQQ
ncbi:carbohydrate ABC transporter permease [Marinicrinis sediminis]|uniref:Carbohydrate ABC transporter permease n=1 Tax=Marinicrinis sediminis TaxID=1652465 RepID=A0ABW5RDA9_9BACL